MTRIDCYLLTNTYSERRVNIQSEPRVLTIKWFFSIYPLHFQPFTQHHFCLASSFTRIPVVQCQLNPFLSLLVSSFSLLIHPSRYLTYYTFLGPVLSHNGYLPVELTIHRPHFVNANSWKTSKTN